MITKLAEKLLSAVRKEPAFSYSLRRSQRAKTTRIVVKTDKIEVVAPPHVSEFRIKAFVTAQQVWIEQALQRVASRASNVDSLAPADYVDGALIPYQGSHLPLSIKATSAKTLKVQLLPDSRFLVYLPVSVEPNQSSERIRLALQQWMKQQSRQLAQRIIDKHSTRFALHPRSLKIKTQKSRWGSCGPHDDINLNWLLILAPPIIMEYVVIHELCHIRHKNHSREFWSLVGQHMPEYLQHRRWLRQHGAGLMMGL
jgi:predicted metal-dependent hydrolase